MKRRDFLKNSVLACSTCLTLPAIVQAASRQSENAFKSGSAFTIWQLPSQINTIGNSYVILTHQGQLIVMDGGMPDEAPYLRGFLAALGGKVEAWFISHPHIDHMGALNAILKQPLGIQIENIYHSRFSEELTDCEPSQAHHTRDFYSELEKSGAKVTDLQQPGLELKFGKMNLKIFGVTNEEFHMNPYNNSSIIIRIWDRYKSFLFLGDAGIECGDKLRHGTYGHDLDCDYLQMAHHGQNGCSEDFYKSFKFKVCLWPTPLWVWNNDQGKGFNTGNLKTLDTRKWMDEIGIKEHYVSCRDGLKRFN